MTGVILTIAVVVLTGCQPYVSCVDEGGRRVPLGTTVRKNGQLFMCVKQSDEWKALVVK